jgi:hypothetical protein
MNTKAVNIKLDESLVDDVKNIASTFHTTITDVITSALNDYIPKLKNDPFYKLTSNIELASKEESDEILEAIDSLSDDDLQISSSKTIN